MLVGHVGKIEPDFIGGWAADTEAPDSIVDVIVYIDGIRANRLPCDRFRQDLRDLEIYGRGNHGFQWHISPPLPLHLVSRVTVRFAGTGGVVPDGERTFPRETGLNAILVTAPGRSGTTVLMSRLAQSRQVCVAEAHPFEVRQISYWSTVVRTLAGPADYARSMHPDRLEGDGFKVGTNPFSHSNHVNIFHSRALGEEYFANFVPRGLEQIARLMIGEYYLRIMEDCQKQGATYFAEKNNTLTEERESSRALCSRTSRKSCWSATRATFCVLNCPISAAARMR
jgi:hypothetical protein